MSLDDLKLENGSRLAGELKVTGNKKGTFGQSVANKQNNILTFIVENRCLVGRVSPVTVFINIYYYYYRCCYCYYYYCYYYYYSIVKIILFILLKLLRLR